MDEYNFDIEMLCLIVKANEALRIMRECKSSLVLWFLVVSVYYVVFLVEREKTNLMFGWGW